MQNRDPQLEVSGNPIGFYEREFYCFSNFSSFQVEWRGRLWPTSEHAYQAAKFMHTNPELFREVHQAKSAHEAFKLAQANKNSVPKEWDGVKLDVMEEILRHKTRQHAYVADKLAQTKELPLVEDSPKDSFWGWGPDKKGRNELGKLWMKIRKDLVNTGYRRRLI